jgi:hypothetical protein
MLPILQPTKSRAITARVSQTTPLNDYTERTHYLIADVVPLFLGGHELIEQP